MENNLVLSILIVASNRASAALGLLGTQAMTLQRAMTYGALAVGAAIVGAGVASVDAAVGFDQAMHKVAGLTGLIQSSGHDMQYWENQILALAPTIDVGPTQLAQALYFVASAGIPASQVMSVLKYSAEAAAATMGNMSQVADLVTSAMNAYKNQGVSAAEATNVIVDAVKNGKVEMHALETSFAFVATTGLSAKFSLEEVAAAVSTLTRVSGNTAARRVQMDLDNLIRRLGDVGGVANTAKKLHLAFNETTFASSGLIQRLQIMMQMSGFTTDTLNDMRKAAHGNEQVFEQMALKAAQNSTTFKALAGGAAAMIPSVILMNDKGATFNQIYAEMSDKTDKVTAAFNTMRQSTGQQMNMLEVTLQSLAITLGLHLLPAVNNFLMAMIKAGRGLIAWLQNSGNINALKNAIQGIAVVVGVILTPSLIGAAIAAAPLVLAISGIIAAGILLGPKIAQLVDHFGGWGNIVKTVADKFNQFKPIILAVAGVITAFFIPAIIKSGVESVIAGIKTMTTFVTSLIATGAAGWTAAAGVIAATWPILLIIAAIAAVVAIIVLMITHWKQVQAVLANVGKWFAGVGEAIAGLAGAIWNALTGVATSVWNGAKAVGTAIVNGIVDGLKAIGEALVTFGQWLYQHNYAVKIAVDTIVHLFNQAKQDVGIAVTAIKTVLTAAWNFIKSGAQAAWSLVKTYIIGPVTDAWNFIQGIATSIENALQTAWNAVVGSVQTAWNKFSTTLSTAWNTLGTVIYNTIVKPITDAIGNMIKDAVQWGVNLIHAFGQGMLNAAGWLAEQGHNVLKGVTGWLGFHSPAPNVPESAYWGSNLVKMFAADMQRAVPLVKSAAQQVMRAAGLAPGGAGSNPATGLGATGGGTGGLGGTLSSLIGSLAGVGSGGGGPTTHYHNWENAFPNATNKAEIEAALKSVFVQRERDNWRRGRRAGMGGGLRAGV